jgi:S1-C subfamily serine protease
MNQATNYIGQWKDNKYDGEGSLIFSSGEKYVGQFKVGEYSGLGILYSSDGSIRLMGLWDRNKFIRSENVTTSQNNSANKNLNPNDQPMARSGTGFRIALGHFVTNNHVIEGCKNILINKSLEGSIEIADKSKDLAIISVPNDSGAVSHLRSTSVKLNESITVSGFPLEGAFSGIAITNGTVSRVTGLKGDR